MGVGAGDRVPGDSVGARVDLAFAKWERMASVASWKGYIPWLALFALTLLRASAQVVGLELPPWTPGTLDIHHISTGRGNSTFFILPDGTTLLVDAGAIKAANSAHTEPPHPDGSRDPGEWIARYILHMLAHDPSLRLDYAVITHLHADHMGSGSPTTKASKNGAYKSSGITEVADYVPIRKVIDRAWPGYDWPQPITDEWVNNYREFLKWQIEHKGLKVERSVQGRNDQITLVRGAGKYPTFEVRNSAANGEVWTGVGTVTRHYFPEVAALKRGDLPTENSCSIALRLSYGKFDYFTAGDMTAFKDEGEPEWHDIERPVALAVGPVDVFLLNHHGYYDADSFFLISNLRPRVNIIPVWSAAQPDRRVLRWLLFPDAYPGPRDVFLTSTTEASRVIFSDWTPRLKALEGHIVVRVAPGGGSYKVMVLDNSSESYRVISVHGPYEAQ
jgi:beta-lactamase superfamily II metal-dependent hydrolase